MLEPEEVTCDIGHRTAGGRLLRRWLPSWSNADVAGEPSISIAERRKVVEQELTAAAGGASLCAISRSAGPVPGVKYLEGRLAVLMELGRAGRRGVDLAAFTADALDRWSERLRSAQEREMGADWTAYYAGGVDELTDA